MKRQVFLTVMLLISLIFPIHAKGLEKKTLGEIRKDLLGKEVVITGFKATSFFEKYQGEEVFLNWHLAEYDSQQGFKKKKGRYLDFYDFDLHAPYRLKGSRGFVESIEIAESSFSNRKRGSSTDVFGDTVKDDDTLNPYFDIVVKLQDGTLLIDRGYYNTIMRLELEMASTVDSIKIEIEKRIDSLIGMKIFPVGYSKIFPPDADIKDITGILKGDIYKLRDIPNFTPLKIIKAKYLESENGVLLKVEFLGDRTGIIFSQFRNDGLSEKFPFVERATSGFLTKIPKSLTAKEVDAIKKGSIFKGMSLDALHYSWGFPKKENNWGTGGEQLIYTDNLLVYIKGDKVVDWQSLSR